MITTADGVELAVRTAGDITDTDRPLAVCLHGFPDTAATWRHLAPLLVDAGFRVAMPCNRGFAPSTAPPGVSYGSGALATDAILVHDVFDGDGDAVIVGHDWGASATYGAAGHEPDRWRRVVGMAVPPGPALFHAVVADLEQLRRCWYMFVFQQPLADMVLPADGHALVARLWAQWSPGYDATADLAEVRTALDGPEHVGAALAAYRVALGTIARDPALAAVDATCAQAPPQPTLYLHGRDDGCVPASVAELAAAGLGDHVTVELVDDAAHFLHLEQPNVVGARVVEFLS